MSTSACSHSILCTMIALRAGCFVAHAYLFFLMFFTNFVAIEVIYFPFDA